jgi:peroxiredoxin Q/BCP
LLDVPLIVLNLYVNHNFSSLQFDDFKGRNMAKLDVGKKAPTFMTVTTDGKKVKLDDIYGKNGVVLYFYPKDNTPGCTTEACDFRDNLAAIKKLGYSVVGVSKDDLKSHKKFIEKQNLNFDLLSDAETDLVEKFGVWQEKKMMGRKYMGIVRTTFLIGKDGKIQKIYENVKVKDHVAEIIKDIKELNK